MGVQLTELIKSEEIDIINLLDRKIAIDAYNWIYQFLSIIRQRDGEPLKDSKGRITSHLSGLFYRTIKLLENGIKPIYVFDGEPPKFKRVTSEIRKGIRAEAEEAWKKALERREYEEARKYAQRAAVITDEIVEDSKKLLNAMGIPVLQAPSEGEAQCAFMVKNGDAWAIATQDYDSLLFGCERLVRNLSITGKRKRGDTYITIKPELIYLQNLLDDLKINQDQLIMLGILIGTDYNPGGVKGIGPSKALELVKEKKTIDKVFEGLEWNHEATPKDIFNLFKKPRVKEKYIIDFKRLDEEKVKSILCDEHDFSEDRVENAIKRLKESDTEQRSLAKWLKK